MESSDASSRPASKPYTAAQVLTILDAPTPRVRSTLHATYGTDPKVLDTRLRLLREVTKAFGERFGDTSVRLFRSPGRINLRGMHVDTHGGYLNLMTHQRETVIAASAVPGDTVTLANTDPSFGEVTASLAELKSSPSFRQDWDTFINAPDVREKVRAQGDQWGRYVQGFLLSAQHRFPNESLRGFCGVVGSDIPHGAALSSSAALCTAGVLATLGVNGLALDRDALVLAARDGEWYTGSRCGVSDQAAMILSGFGELFNVALLAGRFDSSGGRRIPFPEDLRVLVINSHTKRSISGAQLVEYTRNRFAYSMAIEICRQELAALGFPQSALERVHTLPDLAPASLEEHGGEGVLSDVLMRVPDDIALSDLAARYDLPDLEASYEQYFGSAPPELRPSSIRLRGPLLFGIAESERARVFAEALQNGRYDEAGRLMTLGHDGDRRVANDGTPYGVDTNDAALKRLRSAGTSVEHCSGSYGASTPALDALVDAALAGGTLGASLTGAGLAGTVLALCRAESAEEVAEAIRTRLSAPDYAQLAGLDGPLGAQVLEDSVVPNTATAPAGELIF